MALLLPEQVVMALALLLLLLLAHLEQQHAARDADRYEWPQVIILDRADGGEEVKEEERQSASFAKPTHISASFLPSRREVTLPW
jgi:hypothetical protein